MTHDDNFEAIQATIRKRMQENSGQLRDAVARSLGVPLLVGEYRNPFSILDEFDAWFEFNRRKYVDKQSTARIIGDMLHRDPRGRKPNQFADTNYTGMQWRVRHDFGVVVGPRWIVKGSTA